MAKLVKFLVVLVLLTGIGLLAYAYSGLMTPQIVENREALTIKIE
ncbi:hypothetical protein OE810_04310 [Rhodobacteraceae bacterium XHP0102]|nr:hypothetical protein [Rhodobacteraceae bacterium XHP0102]